MRVVKTEVIAAMKPVGSHDQGQSRRQVHLPCFGFVRGEPWACRMVKPLPILPENVRYALSPGGEIGLPKLLIAPASDSRDCAIFFADDFDYPRPSVPATLTRRTRVA